MKFDIRRAAAAGAVSALAAGALVATATNAGAAQAVTGQQYNCTATGFPAFPVFVTSSVPALGAVEGSGVAAGTDIPDAYMSISSTLTIPDAVYQGMVGNNVDTVTVQSLVGEFGPTAIGIADKTVAITAFTRNDNPDPTLVTWSAAANSFNNAFEVPAADPAGYDVVSPTSYHFLGHITDAPAGTGIAVGCALPTDAAPGVYGHVPVFKNDSTTKATPTKPSFHRGKVAKVKATVLADQMPTGKVLLKNKAGKTLDSAVLSSLGKATLATSKLPVGKNRLNVVYKGDGYDNGSSHLVTVKVVR